jgi:hypothetical protein
VEVMTGLYTAEQLIWRCSSSNYCGAIKHAFSATRPLPLMMTSASLSCENRALRLHTVPSDHLFLDSAPNLGPLISRWEIAKFENCWYKSAGILEVLKLLLQQLLNLSSFQRDMSGPILGTLSNNRWSGGICSWMDWLNSIFRCVVRSSTGM